MYYVDGEVATVGTKKGKSYLNSHPAIIATFQSLFLYGNNHRFDHQYNTSYFIILQMTLKANFQL